MNKNVNEMTRKEFEALPYAKWNEEVICNSLIILPGRAKDMHDSGYRVMTFVAVLSNIPKCLISGCSDVINLDGIGGLGYKWLTKFVRKSNTTKPSKWQIDCLPKSGLLRIYSSCKLITGASLSNFELYTLQEDRETK